MNFASALGLLLGLEGPFARNFSEPFRSLMSTSLLLSFLCALLQHTLLHDGVWFVSLTMVFTERLTWPRASSTVLLKGNTVTNRVTA